MKMPNDYIEYLGFTSLEDLVENLYLSSMVEAFRGLDTSFLSGLNENDIRNKLQYELSFNCGKISGLINDRSIELVAEGQIIIKNYEIKRTDITFFIPKFLYVIECKKVSGARQRQYIDEGINRFVSRIYINESEKYAGMCSFITSGNPKGIIDRLTKKVSKFHGKEIISEPIGKLETSFRSIHVKNHIEVYIHHLFFDCRG